MSTRIVWVRVVNLQHSKLLNATLVFFAHVPLPRSEAHEAEATVLGARDSATDDKRANGQIETSRFACEEGTPSS